MNDFSACVHSASHINVPNWLHCSQHIPLHRKIMSVSVVFFEVSAAEQGWTLGDQETKHVFKNLWLLGSVWYLGGTSWDFWEAPHGTFATWNTTDGHDGRVWETNSWNPGSFWDGYLSGAASRHLSWVVYPWKRRARNWNWCLQEPSLGRMGEFLSLPIC